MKQFDEVYRLIVDHYDQHDLDHWYMMHRAGLVHLVASELDIPECIVEAIINYSHGPVDADHAAMDKIKDNGRNGRDDT